MSRKYKFRDNDKLYFVSFSVVYWLDVFIRDEYRLVLLDSLRYCMVNKGLEVYGYCIMTSHVHLVVGSQQEPLQDIMRDLKSHTSNQLKKAINENPQESRKEWLLWLMERAGKKNGNNKGFQFWQQHNHPIELHNNALLQQKLDYIHQNPVEAGFVSSPEDFTYSSARDYAGEKGLLDIMLIE
ncbi:REP-associated tyrosine transposase [Pontibacter akesuensis]|uniref:Transposase IS200 like n=1 Tax=Pontibacter akesuensis TaxID=388950 RepID=A0A1I7KKX5_9BACT|nr:transposase [Pontibacter akesuensis]GHA78062.1 transposase [Pontibacter akesuensis]SFU98102.1 Transposase IS200 like [Pontibacter akesuensis]